MGSFSRFSDLKRAVESFAQYLSPDIGGRLQTSHVFECPHIGEPDFDIPNGDRPGVYAFLFTETESTDETSVAYIGKSQQRSGVQRRITENYREYCHEKNRGYPVTHCIAFVWPKELHFLAPALECCLLEKLSTRDNARLRG